MAKRRNTDSGVAALTTILGIGLVVALMGAALGLLAFLEGSIGFSHVKSQEAFLVAQSGASDALMRLARDKTFTSPSGYTLAVGNGTSTVTVTSPAFSQKTITSQGEVSARKRKVEVKIVVDDRTGNITVLSWQEVSL